jgi:hypothetical protein
MRRRRLLIAAAMMTAVLLPATSAGAHDPDDGDHSGGFIPSPESQSQNTHLMASIPRARVTSYTNSDLAFWGRTAYAGNYDGFRTIDISDPENPQVLANVVCQGSQHDVSVYQGWLFLSVDSPRSKPECDGVPMTGGAPGFEGIRIFDVRDPANPVYAGAVATDCGSHTHTLIPDGDRVLLYVSSYPASNFGASSYGNSCARLNLDGTQGHSKISVVEVPLANPTAARVVSQPHVELRDFRSIAGYRGCHDISVFTAIKRAAAACLSEGQIWDISDPVNPRTIARVHNSNVDIWHSASFTYDGKVTLFGDEAGGGSGARCRSSDPSTLGAIWFYDLASLDNQDATSEEPRLGHFKIPRVQGDSANCTMHNFNVLPLAGRYVGVSAAYSGGTSVFDFTDPANAREIGHFDPHGANVWSSYWYNGFFYTNDSGRGVDIVLLSDPARASAQRLDHLNPQTQLDLIF